MYRFLAFLLLSLSLFSLSLQAQTMVQGTIRIIQGIDLCAFECGALYRLEPDPGFEGVYLLSAFPPELQPYVDERVQIVGTAMFCYTCQGMIPQQVIPLSPPIEPVVQLSISTSNAGVQLEWEYSLPEGAVLQAFAIHGSENPHFEPGPETLITYTNESSHSLLYTEFRELQRFYLVEMLWSPGD